MCGRQRRRRRQWRLHTDRWSTRPLAKVSAGLLKRGMWNRSTPGSRACRDAPSDPSLSSLSLALFSYSHLVVTFPSSVLSLIRLTSPHPCSALRPLLALLRTVALQEWTWPPRLASSLLSHFTAILPSVHSRNIHRLFLFRKSLRRVSHFKAIF